MQRMCIKRTYYGAVSTLTQISSPTRKESTSAMQEVRREISEPPLVTSYQALLQNNDLHSTSFKNQNIIVHEIDLPLIDLCNLQSENRENRILCAEEIISAASEWGFFQVLNHGISLELLEKINREQLKLFRLPFEKKVSSGVLNDSYRWGNPTAMSASQFSWSEAFHVPLEKISDEDCNYVEFSSLREIIKKLAMAMSSLAQTIADILAQNLGYTRHDFPQNCDERTCFLRLNRYPPCPFSLPDTGGGTSGLISHTDSDYLTILHQDQVGGLQVMKDSRWVSVRPNRNALIVNIGDLFQAWSNDVYRSVEHRVIVNADRERFSFAYFLCPSYESTIGAYAQPSRYRSFTFGEFREQVQEDVKRIGRKVGLPRFLMDHAEQHIHKTDRFFNI